MAAEAVVEAWLLEGVVSGAVEDCSELGDTLEVRNERVRCWRAARANQWRVDWEARHRQQMYAVLMRSSNMIYALSVNVDRSSDKRAKKKTAELHSQGAYAGLKRH